MDLSVYLVNHNSGTETNELDYVLNRILDYFRKGASQIIDNFRIEGWLEVEEQVVSTLLYTIERRPDLMENKHSDQMLLATLYYILKKHQVRFNDIIIHHQHVNRLSNSELKELVAFVKTPHQHINIIEFYNHHYLPFLKHSNPNSPTTHPQSQSELQLSHPGTN